MPMVTTMPATATQRRLTFGESRAAGETVNGDSPLVDGSGGVPFVFANFPGEQTTRLWLHYYYSTL